MLDDSEHLSTHPKLVRLLAHYVQADIASPETWQNRVDQLESTEPRELSKLHGRLLAYGWLEPNLGAVPCCYRATPAGRRALRKYQAKRVADNTDAEAA